MSDEGELTVTIDTSLLNGQSELDIDLESTPGSGASEIERPVSRFLSRIRFGSSADASGFASETSRLLRSRLLAYLVISVSIMTLGFVIGGIQGLPMVGMRFAVLMMLVAACLILYRDKSLTMRQLRFIESISLGGIVVQLSILSWLRIESSAIQGDVAEALLASQFMFTVFCLAILTYGIFIPNAWKRAAMVLLPISMIPMTLMFLLRQVSPEFDLISQSAMLSKPIPETLVAALIAIYGSHVIQGIRREAFQAKQLGQYVLKHSLGTGGMGEVYLAEHRMLKRPCAIKLIHADSESNQLAINRFEQEVRSTARLSHWNSVEVYDYGRTEDGTFYYVMELLPGANLDDIVKRHGPMEPARAIHFLIQICDALDEAHSQGLIHRDIKPANIFASVRGGINDVGKLLDFGLVRQSTDETGESTGFAGTPAFMPPEQATAFDQVDRRADVYALGAVGFFLLIGHPPFVGKSLQRVLACHRCDPVPSMQALNPAVPEDVEAILRRCLEKSPTDRFQSVKELRASLMECEDSGQWNAEKAGQWWAQHPMDAASVEQDMTQPMTELMAQTKIAD